MKRIALLTATAAIAAAASVPAAAHGTEERGERGDYGHAHGHFEGMMEMMHGFEYGRPGMMGGGYGGPGPMMGGGMMRGPQMMQGGGMFAGPGMMYGAGQMGFGHPGGMGHFGMSGSMFESIDADGDGVVTLDEARAAHTARLEEFDADGDGRLSIDEFENLHSAAIRELMVDRFQFLDADGDGQVTQEEMNAPIDRVSRFMQLRDRFGPERVPAGEDDDDARPRRYMDEDDMPGRGGGGRMHN